MDEHGRADHVPRHAEHALVGHLEVGLELPVQVVQLRIEAAAAVLGRTAGPADAGVERLRPPRLAAARRASASPSAAIRRTWPSPSPQTNSSDFSTRRGVRLEELRRSLHELLTHLLIHPCLHSCRVAARGDDGSRRRRASYRAGVSVDEPGRYDAGIPRGTAALALDLAMEAADEPRR